MSSQVNIKDLAKDPVDDEGKPRSSSTRGKSTKRPAPTEKAERDLKGRIGGMLDRLAESLEARGDDEMAGIVREDAAVIASALVSFTRPFRLLRAIVLGAIAIIEPLLAFGRIGRALAIRVSDARHARAEARRAAMSANQAESDGSNGSDAH